MEIKEKNSPKDYLKLARLDHWIKQLFIIPGIAFAAILVGNISVQALIINFVAGFLSTCLIASANYVINEWLDAEFDKYHPTKKYRTAVLMNLKARYVYIEYAILAVSGLIVSYIISWPVFLMELWLLLMGIIYNVRPIRSKEFRFIDVLTESINNAIRLLIGWFIVTSVYLPPVTIVLGYWMGGAFLMAIKRYAEYRAIGDKETAALYRKSFEKYTEESLLVSAFFYALASVFFSGIFLIKYRIELLLAIPFLCGLFCYYLHISYKKDSAAQKPEKLFKERGLMVYMAVFIGVILLLMLVDVPILEKLLSTSFIGI
jgi:decaprenyl-phosphate phosphoribosyltransferase